MSPPSPLLSTQNPKENDHKDGEKLVFDPYFMSCQNEIPSQFLWPEEEKPSIDVPELHVPQIDLNAFLSGDPLVVSNICAKVDEACKKHGFFHLVNHGVDNELIAKAHSIMDEFFCMTLEEKKKAQRPLGDTRGYASSFVGRFTSKLPWKETLSLPYVADGSTIVEDYIVDALGEDFRSFGAFYQMYSDVMSDLSLKITELLGVSLGVGSKHFREFYEGNESSLRLNYYPPCHKPDLTLGTGPHFDPTSITILHEDQVGGLQVFVDNKWHSVTPKQDAFVINIGDTFMALSNGIYKSCMHRAVVNSTVVRRSLAFFLNPNAEKVVTPPKELIDDEHPRIYPDFAWPTLLEFTQKHYRADTATIDVFSKWLHEKGTN